MLKFKTSCTVLAYLSSNLLGLFLLRYFEVGLRVCDIVVKKFTFAISSPDEFLYNKHSCYPYTRLPRMDWTGTFCENGRRNTLPTCSS